MPTEDDAAGRAAPVLLDVPQHVDAAAAPALRAALQAAGRPGATVVVDLGGVRYLDSAGLAVLLSARQSADRHGWTLSVRAASPRVQRHLRISGLSWLLQP